MAPRWAWVEIDLAALDHNVRHLVDVVAPSQVWAVVKANGYGHGSQAVARQALSAGAHGLCVALVSEAIELRSAGIEVPMMVLSQQPIEHLLDLVAHGVSATVYTNEYVAALEAAARATGRIIDVHLKVDTGMQRVGADPEDVVVLAAQVAASPSLRLHGVFTHLACADDPGHPANRQQLDRFDGVLERLRVAGLAPTVVHAANSAGALAHPGARFDLVRAGISIYGVSPGVGVDHHTANLRPVMSVKSRVSHIKRVAAGSHVSYGWRHRFEHATVVATVPIGYADGVPRRLGTLPDAPGADVLIAGRRVPIVGVVTMDQLMVDLGPDPVVAGDVKVGTEVVLIGRQGEHTITAEDWASRLGTIGYEIVCGISARVPRLVV